MQKPVRIRLERSMGLFGATGVGVGAIVGGGILVMAGTAFVSTGPSAVIAFAINGFIALLTALSYAEMAAAFPESGGTYTFSKKVLSAPAAFMVGWVTWFASAVAAVLYALGFASFAAVGLERIIQLTHLSVSFSFTSRGGTLLLAVAATMFYSISLIRKNTGGKDWATWGKVLVFMVIICAGLLALARQSFQDTGGHLSPFFTGGTSGLLKAMGFTFIALQGFDIIAAVAGEVKEPEKNIPRGMLLSLGIALCIYLPLLYVIATVGVPPERDIIQMSLSHPDTIVAEAIRNFMGTFGYWLVMTAAVLAMLSALRANLMAASRVAMRMASDRTLPRVFGRISRTRNTPVHSIALTLVMVIATLLIIPDVAAAGAAASLIFLVSFALTHWTSILARIRVGAEALPFRAPCFPVLQIVGGSACVGLAIFQGTQVPSAGIVSAVWLGAGLVLYLIFFARRAQIVDISNAALDPSLQLLRGRSPLVLVPVSNPANAGFMVSLANAMVPPAVGRVLLLSVMSPPKDLTSDTAPVQLVASQEVVKEALTASFHSGLTPEALVTVAPHTWNEIIRVARTYQCESILLGLSDLTRKAAIHDLEQLMSRVNSDVVVLRANNEWGEQEVMKRGLIPVGGRGQQDVLRARIVGRLPSMGINEITFLRVLPEDTPEEALKRSGKWLRQLAEDEGAPGAEILVVRSNRPADEIINRAAETDLLILGLQRQRRHLKVFGDMVLSIARNTSCGLILINRKG